jgi:hypothetical protein
LFLKDVNEFIDLNVLLRNGIPSIELVDSVTVESSVHWLSDKSSFDIDISPCDVLSCRLAPGHGVITSAFDLLDSCLRTLVFLMIVDNFEVDEGTQMI